MGEQEQETAKKAPTADTLIGEMRHTAAFIAADMAKTLVPGASESVASRVDDVLAAADKVFAWLTSASAVSA